MAANKSVDFTWKGDAVLKDVAQRAANGLTEIDLRIESEAKAELYEGHGKRSGNLQRAIQGGVATVQGTYVRGQVAVKGIPYAMYIHRLYKYITIGLNRVRPRAPEILSKHMRRKA